MAGIHKQSLVLVTTIIGAGFILSITSLYYIKVFLNEFNLSTNYLKIVQILFLVWNAVNDPIMGYMQDLGCANMKWIMDRRKVILYAGPVFAFSFLLFWFPWSTTVGWLTALHLLVALFIYDTLFTLVLSAYCGLCVENSQNHKDRVRVIVYGEIFTIIAGFLIYPIETIPHSKENFWMFQVCCVLIAIISAGLMAFSGWNLETTKPVNENHQMNNEFEELNDKSGSKDSSWNAVVNISWQIIKEPRFICLVAAQFFRILRFMANDNFLIIYTESLLIKGGLFSKHSSNLGIFYIVTRSMGSVLFLVLWKATNRFGTQAIIQFLNILTFINIGVVLYYGQDYPIAVAAFMIIENALCRCGWQGFYIVVAGEVVDTDMKRNNRKNPFSTIIFTLKALFTKPADQLASVFVLAFFLEKGGYPTLTETCIDNPMVPLNSTLNSTDLSSVTLKECQNYTNWMFIGLVTFPAICAIGEAIFVAIDQICKKNEIRDQENGKQATHF